MVSASEPSYLCLRHGPIKWAVRMQLQNVQYLVSMIAGLNQDINQNLSSTHCAACRGTEGHPGASRVKVHPEDDVPGRPRKNDFPTRPRKMAVKQDQGASVKPFK